jgi:DNA-binding NtrC family response regulator
VLISGESGVGKELVAAELHRRSNVTTAPFVAVNCGAISPTLAESELFGHERGAFTGALTARRGLFEAAQGGTLFLDEIAELSLPLQAALLRTLETRTVRRVGGQQELPVRVRVVAASHRDLRRACGQGRFRFDLYQRLATVPIEVPPLRTHLEDLPELVDHLLAQLGEPAARTWPREPLLAALRGYRWPGNVRELRNALQRAVVLGEAGRFALDELLPESEPLTYDSTDAHVESRCAEDRATTGESAGWSRAAAGATRGRTMAELEHAIYLDAVALHGSLRAAARALGVPRSTFAERAKRFGVAPAGCNRSRLPEERPPAAECAVTPDWTDATASGFPGPHRCCPTQP